MFLSSPVYGEENGRGQEDQGTCLAWEPPHVTESVSWKQVIWHQRENVSTTASFHFSHDVFSTLSLTPLTSLFWVTVVVNNPVEVATTGCTPADATSWYHMSWTVPFMVLGRMGLSLRSTPDVLGDIKLLYFSSPAFSRLKKRGLYQAFYILLFLRSIAQCRSVSGHVKLQRQLVIFYVAYRLECVKLPLENAIARPKQPC